MIKMNMIKCMFIFCLTLCVAVSIQIDYGDGYSTDVSLSAELDTFTEDENGTSLNEDLKRHELLLDTSFPVVDITRDLDNVTDIISASESETETETESESKTEVGTETETETEDVVKAYDEIKCKEGLLLSVWRPTSNITNGDRFARGLVYFLVMCYLFLGVSIVSDRFMAAIEKITAIEKVVFVRKPDGTKQKIVVRVWNETVANLTLMALGTSAPEILLSIIEIFTMNFQAGELGPGTIVGSAAYNLFTIIAICIIVIPNNEVRRIKHLRVFFVTSAFSNFAYIWMYLILAYFSPGIVTVIEGLITFMFFPLIVWIAYIADRRLLIYKYFNKSYRMNARGVMIQTETLTGEPKPRSDSIILEDGSELLPSDYRDPDQIRREYVSILQDLKQKYPQYDRDRLEMMTQEQLLNSGPKSRAFYRIQATRKILGGCLGLLLL